MSVDSSRTLLPTPTPALAPTSAPQTLVNMLARSAKPKLSLSVSIQATRPTLAQTLKSPLAMTPLRSPISPIYPNSPTALNTKLNRRGLSTFQTPTYAYANSSSSRSILKRSQSTSSSSSSSTTPSAASASSSAVARCRQLQFSDKPEIHCVTPIEEEDYYGSYRKMSREERRWQPRP